MNRCWWLCICQCRQERWASGYRSSNTWTEMFSFSSLLHCAKWGHRFFYHWFETKTFRFCVLRCCQEWLWNQFSVLWNIIQMFSSQQQVEIKIVYCERSDECHWYLQELLLMWTGFVRFLHDKRAYYFRTLSSSSAFSLSSAVMNHLPTVQWYCSHGTVCATCSDQIKEDKTGRTCSFGLA
jgi:hypothetical protein